jgi:hypothetical protein
MARLVPMSRFCGRRARFPRIAVLSTVLVTAATRTSLAASTKTADEQSFGWERHFALSLHAGLRNPLAFGVAYEVSPVYFLSLETGAGLAEWGPQLGTMLRLRMPARSMAFSIAGGLSRGPFRLGGQDCFLGCATVGSLGSRSWSAAVWQNLELSLDRRGPLGFQIRLYIGLRSILNEASAECRGIPAPCRTPDYYTGYLGISLGYAL